MEKCGISEGVHPAPFPVALISQIIRSTTAEVILDPFMGSGTTAIAALIHGRKYIGIEISPEYIDMANTRIAKYYATQEASSYKSAI
ncbi:DNA methyltransferase [Rhodoflexus sp.]